MEGNQEAPRAMPISEVDEAKSPSFVREKFATVQNNVSLIADKAKQSSPVVKVHESITSSPHSFLAQYGLEKIEAAATPLVARLGREPLVARIGDPLIDRLDNGITAFSHLVQTGKDKASKAKAVLDNSVQNAHQAYSLVGQTWANNVDTIMSTVDTFKPVVQPENVQAAMAAFVDALSAQFVALRARTSASGGSAKASADAFIDGVRSRLGVLWEDNMRAPAAVFYHRATDFAKTTGGRLDDLSVSIVPKLGVAWHEASRLTLHRALERPSFVVYQAALATYTDAKRKVHVQVPLPAHEFVQRVRERLAQAGATWTDQMRGPVLEFLASAREQAHELRQNPASRRGVVQSVSGLVRNTWKSLLAYSVDTFDKFVPADEDTNLDKPGRVPLDEYDAGLEPEPSAVSAAGPAGPAVEGKSLAAHTAAASPSLVGVAQHVVLRVHSRLQSKARVGYGRAKDFSATRLKSVIKVDVLEFAEQTLTSVQAAAAPRVQAVQTRTNDALALVRARVKEVRQAMSLVAEAAVIGVQPRVKEVRDRVAANPALSALRERLHNMLQTARSLRLKGAEQLQSGLNIASAQLINAYARAHQQPQLDTLLTALEGLVSSLKNLTPGGQAHEQAEWEPSEAHLDMDSLSLTPVSEPEEELAGEPLVMHEEIKLAQAQPESEAAPVAAVDETQEAAAEPEAQPKEGARANGAKGKGKPSGKKQRK